VPVGYVKELANYWLHGFDWPKQQTLLNRLPQFTTLVDGQTLHFLHIRSRERNARPLLLIHGWPGSFVEFLDLIGPLTDPRAHGGEPSDAFDLVIPSVPGHGFSRPLSGLGWTHGRCAAAYAKLMARLGYQHYGVHGGDVGAFQAPEVGRADGEHVIGIHVNALVTFPPSDPAATEGLTPSELERLARLRDFGRNGNGYLQIQATRPMSLAYGLQDSPAGQLAWIAEKFKEWATKEVDRDRILTNVSLYWFTGTAGSSANLYYETYHDDSIWRPRPPGTVPTAVLVSLTQDVAIRRFAEQAHRVVQWTETDRGGHFMALEAPEVLVDDLRQFFREMA
jgi:pimeloyl-ACP methyl ester carboxylesterase